MSIKTFLTWKNRSVNITHQRIYRSDDEGAVWTLLATIPIGDRQYEDFTGNVTALTRYRVASVLDSDGMMLELDSSSVTPTLIIPVEKHPMKIVTGTDRLWVTSYTPLNIIVGGVLVEGNVEYSDVNSTVPVYSYMSNQEEGTAVLITPTDSDTPIKGITFVSGLAKVLQWASVGYESHSEVIGENTYYVPHVTWAGCQVTEVPSTLHPSITDLSRLFLNCETFNQDISSWDVSNVTTMESMFAQAVSFNQPIGGWDTSSVTNMVNMFNSAIAFNQDISDWDVSNVTNMQEMFTATHVFDQPIGKWNVSNVTNMAVMFGGSIAFNQPLNDWDVSKVTDMSGMFQETVAFNQDISNWNVESVTSMSALFMSAESFNQPLNDWNVSNVTDMSYLFQNTKTFNQPIGSWDVSNVVNMNAMFDNIHAYNQDMSKWCVQHIATTPYYWNTRGLTINAEYQPVWGTCPAEVVELTPLVGSASATVTLSIASLDRITVRVGGELIETGSTAAPYMYTSAYTTVARPVEIASVDNVSPLPVLQVLAGLEEVVEWGTFDTSTISLGPDIVKVPSYIPAKMTDLSYVFANSILINDPNIALWDVSNVTVMSDLFANASAFNQDISGWDVSKVTKMDSLIIGTKAFEQDLSQWCVANILTKPSNFNNMSAITEEKLPVWGSCPRGENVTA